jgi:hypothetical protein
MGSFFPVGGSYHPIYCARPCGWLDFRSFADPRANGEVAPKAVVGNRGESGLYTLTVYPAPSITHGRRVELLGARRVEPSSRRTGKMGEKAA